MQSIGQSVTVSKVLFGRIFEVLDLPVEITDRPDDDRHRTRGSSTQRSSWPLKVD
jgi:hypothetical protein